MKPTLTVRRHADGTLTLRRPDGATRRIADMAEAARLAAPLVAAMRPAMDMPTTGAPAEDRTPFYAVLMLLGVETDEDPEWNRLFGEAVPRREFPMPLWWEDSSAHGEGEFALIGRLDEFHPEGLALLATGSVDNTLDAAQRAMAGLANGANAISVDYSFEEPTVVECTEWDPDNPEWCLRQRLYAPKIAIGGATLCGLGAFAQARISLDGFPTVDAQAAPPAVEPPPCDDCEDGESEITVIVAGNSGGAVQRGALQGDFGARAATTIRAVTAALALPTYPARFFAEPAGLTTDHPLTVTDDGRIFGAYPTTVCHRGLPGDCQTAPTDPDFGEFLLTPITLDDGTRVMAGPLTFRGDAHVAHPSLSIAAVRAAYDNTASVAGLITMGHGDGYDWYSGVLRPDLTEDELWEIAACAQVSGHWQPVGNRSRLAAMHVVPTPGFPARSRALAASAAPALIPGPSPLPWLTRQVAALTARVAALAPLAELYPQVADAVVASVGPIPLVRGPDEAAALLDAIRHELAARRGA